MRLLLSTALALILPSVAAADDLLLRADISDATIYARGAEITRRVSVELVDGQTRVVIPMRDLNSADLLQVTGPDGLRLGAPERIEIPIEDGALDHPAEAAARAVVEAAEDTLQDARDALAAADTDIRGFTAQLDYLSALSRGGPDGAAMPDDPAVLAQVLATLGGETTRVSQALNDARIARRTLEEVAEEAEEDLQRARDALEDLNPFKGTTDAVAFTVDGASAGPAEFEITYLIGSTGWSPTYEVHLDSDTGAMRMDRSIAFYYDGPAAWRDVAIRFSTADPGRQSTPTGVFPAPARVEDAMPIASVRGGIAVQAEALSIAPAVEPVVVMEDRAELEVSGLSVAYRYQDPVTVGASGFATLPFDSLDLSAELENRAAPRYDRTAFLVAMAENTSGEPILPGDAALFRDGELIGELYMPLFAEGAEIELAFGALDHLSLTWQDLSRDEGDRGVFVSDSEQSRVIRFSVQNTSDTPETVRVLYATPFSEQEDLQVDVQLSTAPDARNVDDLRGVHAWDMALAPGEEASVEMEVYLRWPEDQVLAWWP